MDNRALPVFCQHCGVALAIMVQPFSPGEEGVSGFLCPTCHRVNQTACDGDVVGVRLNREDTKEETKPNNPEGVA